MHKTLMAVFLFFILFVSFSYLYDVRFYSSIFILQEINICTSSK